MNRDRSRRSRSDERGSFLIESVSPGYVPLKFMNRSLLVIAITVVAACRSQTPPLQDVAEVTVPPADAPAMTTSVPASTPAESNFGQLSLEPGFIPDPHVVDGTSGGSTDSSTFDPLCIGFISRIPDVLFEASGTFANLHIMAASDGDVTLVVQRPDGTYLCNDDMEGLNPMVSGPFPRGVYKIWVGDFDPREATRFRLGISELSTASPRML